MIEIIPAIDLRKGKVVRLAQGLAVKETVYPVTPLEVARKWDACGVKLIHIVDLDGALDGMLRNFDTAKEIARNVRAKVELGGGIRDLKNIEGVLGSGIYKVCIGTRALDRRFLQRIAKSGLQDRIVVSIDARDGIVHTKGWVNKTRKTAVELAREAAASGIKTINYTDISRDGMLGGPNIDSLKNLLRAVNINIVAAGGISSIDDIRKLKSLDAEGLSGIIIGKALYENKIDLKEAIRICSQSA